jgi:hypothetical protein
MRLEARPAIAAVRGLRTLCVGYESGTCLDRANAMRRLGHSVDFVDLRKSLPASRWVDQVTRRFGGDWFERRLLKVLPQHLSGRRYDLCYVDGGEWVTPRLIECLRQHADRVINYNIDDPFGPRDGQLFKAYRSSVPSYDLCVVVRSQNVAEARALGARDVLLLTRAADEVSHAPRRLTAEDHRLWDSEVLFLGTWFPERGPFLFELVKRGVPLTIRGGRWNRAPEWRHLGPHYAGGHISGDDYAKAIQCARINLGLLSKGNRDLHTTRSLEIPALGGLLCAERTSEHLAMYQEGREALFWQDADECAEVCRRALRDEAARRSIAAAGHGRIAHNGHYNEKLMSAILARVYGDT